MARTSSARPVPSICSSSLDDLGNGFEGAKYVCSPPLRDRAEEHQETLWQGLRPPTTSRSSPPTTARSAWGDHPEFGTQKQLGEGTVLAAIPNGLPGVEHRMELIYHGGVHEERLGLEPFRGGHRHHPGQDVRSLPAEGDDRRRLRRRHRRVRPECEAHTLSAETHHMWVDYSCYEGLEITGKVETVLSAGARHHREPAPTTATPGDGRYLRRGSNQYLI